MEEFPFRIYNPQQLDIFNQSFSSLSPLERHRIRQKLQDQKKKQTIEAANRIVQNVLSLSKVRIPTLNEAFPCLLGIVPTLPVSVHLHFSHCKPTFQGRRAYLKKQKALYLHNTELFKTPFFQTYTNTLIEWFNQEQTCKTAFRRLAQLWLYKHYKGRMLNTEDPVTLEKPKLPIYLYDSVLQGTYVFEASTIKFGMETTLSYTDWLFPEPSHPKNPFTNIEFTEAQRLSLLTSLQRIGFGSWILEAYRSLHWDLELFATHYTVPLKLRALSNLVKNPTLEETRTYVKECIEEQFLYHRMRQRAYIPPLRSLYWGVDNCCDHPHIVRWYKFFQRQMTHFITTGGTHADIVTDQIQIQLYKESKELLYDKDSHIELRTKYIGSLQPIPLSIPIHTMLRIPGIAGITDLPEIHTAQEIQNLPCLEIQLGDLVESESESSTSTEESLTESEESETEEAEESETEEAQEEAQEPVDRIVVQLQNGSIRIIQSSNSENRTQPVEDGADS